MSQLYYPLWAKFDKAKEKEKNKAAPSITELQVPNLNGKNLLLEQKIFERLDTASDEVLSSLSGCEKETLCYAYPILIFSWLCDTRSLEFSKKNDHKIFNGAITNDMVHYLIKTHKLNIVKLIEFKQFLVYYYVVVKLRHPDLLHVHTIDYCINEFKVNPDFRKFLTKETEKS